MQPLPSNHVQFSDSQQNVDRNVVVGKAEYLEKATTQHLKTASTHLRSILMRKQGDPTYKGKTGGWAREKEKCKEFVDYLEAGDDLLPHVGPLAVPPEGAGGKRAPQGLDQGCLVSRQPMAAGPQWNQGRVSLPNQHCPRSLQAPKAHTHSLRKQSTDAKCPRTLLLLLY